MKRILTYAMLVMAVLFGSVASVSAQSKAAQKDAKKRVKELKKEGWTLMTSTHTMEYEMTQYNAYMEEDDNRVALTGIAIGKNNKIGRDNAIMNAITSYASRAASQVTGKMKSLMSSDVSDTADEIDKFGAAYEVGVNTKLQSIVKQHFIIYREDSNGNKEYNAYLSLDETQARKAREEAAEEARRSAALKTLSEQVSEFIGEPVEAEE